MKPPKLPGLQIYANVYDLRVYREAHHLRNQTQMAGCIVRSAQAMNMDMELCEKSLRKSGANLFNIAGILETYVAKIDETLEYANQCEEAWMLDDVDEMEARCQLLAKRRRRR